MCGTTDLRILPESVRAPDVWKQSSPVFRQCAEISVPLAGEEYQPALGRGCEFCVQVSSGQHLPPHSKRSLERALYRETPRRGEQQITAPDCRIIENCIPFNRT